MFTNKLKSGLSCFVFLAFLLGVVDSVSARSVSLESQQQRSAADISSITAQTGDLILFSQFLKEDIFLNAPYDADNIYFNLPVSWRLTPGAQLNLSMSVMFSQSDQVAASGISQGYAGNITVTLNDVFVGLVPVESSGKTTFQLDIPQEAFLAEKEDNVYRMQFFLRSSGICLLGENTLIIIHTDSSMNLPHQSILPDTSLVNFPSPIFQGDAVFTTPVLVVIPDRPTAVELQSALTIAAGLGNISSSQLVMDLNVVSRLTPEQIANNNFILIGKAVSHISDQLKLSLPVTGGVFANPGGNVDDGIIQLVNSPWSEDKVILVVSGNTDAATLKAAQAVSTGVLRPNVSPNVAIVDAVKTAPLPVAPSVDQTLGDMGYSGKELKNIGVNYATYYFYIPPGKTVSEDAYFELEYGHSSLLQYDRDGIVANVNGKPVGSVSFTEETARQAVNKVRFSLPSSAVLAGNNRLEVKVSLTPIDKCSNPDFDAIYANIWPESNLHLPLTAVLVNPTAASYNLISYPAPFVYTSTLDSTAFVLQRDDLASWRDAFQVAVYLGDRSDGAVTTLSTYYADELSENVRSKYNFIAIGRISKLPILNEINKFLPAPFDFGQNLALEPEMQVKYRINPNAAVGYVELLSSPWNSEKVFLAAVGNDAQGVNWAASHLIAPLSYKLSGNFSVINDQRVYTADTRLALLTPGVIAPTQTSILEVVPPVIGNPGASTLYRPIWLLPALILSLVMIVITVIAAIYINRLQNRSGASRTVYHDQKNE